MNERIHADKYYSASKIAKMGVLPWSSNMSFIKKLEEPYWAKIFNPVVESYGDTRRFYVKGQNILDFIKLAEEGKLK